MPDKPTPRPWSTNEQQVISNLVTQYGSYLFAIAVRRTRDPDLSQDLVSEVWEGVMSARDGVDFERNMKSYLAKALSNCIAEHFRKPSTKQTVRLAQSSSSRTANNAARAASVVHKTGPQEIVARNEAQQRLRAVAEQVSAQLTDDERTILTFAGMDGFDLNDTAEILNIKYEAAKSRLRRARVRAREIATGLLGQNP
ncbi:MAG: sigma-70 family RNA polymerase sigma factor [Deltaproteobacteria bacterium]|nr:sigma-70 family RNA polymerase sigma factor [Deltaproteobacteria bacterium]